MRDKAKEGTLTSNGSAASSAQPKKRRRWDQTSEEAATPQQPPKKKSSWDEAATPSNTRWDETPGRAKGSETPGATPGSSSTRMWDPTPAHAATPGAMTPGRETPGNQATPSASTRKNRWDETPKTDRGEILEKEFHPQLPFSFADCFCVIVFQPLLVITVDGPRPPRQIVEAPRMTN